MARLPSLEGEHTNQVDWHRQKLVAISPVLHDRGYRAPITSGLPLRTDIGSIGRHVSALFDHLVGAGEKGRRDFNTERFRRIEINDKQEFGGLLSRKLGRFGAFQNSIDIVSAKSS
jgi:hypothetical protein